MTTPANIQVNTPHGDYDVVGDVGYVNNRQGYLLLTDPDDFFIAVYAPGRWHSAFVTELEI